MRLSKSQYIRGLQCQKSLWLYRHRRDLTPKTPSSLQAIFDQGHEVGELAWRRFPGGHLIEEDYLHAPQAIRSTEAALKAGKKILYEGAFLFNGVLVRPDILVKRAGRHAWDLIEVKSSTAVKDVYHDDVAVQKYVLEGAGLNIRRSFLMHVNNQYVRQGGIDPKDFFTLAEISAYIGACSGDIPGRIRKMQAVLALKMPPDIDIGPHCSDPYECEFAGHCWGHIPDYSVYDLVRVRHDKLSKLLDEDILRIENIPEDFPLSKSQELQVKAAKSGKPIVDKKAIAEFLKDAHYPLFHLDFETVALAIPPYDGLRPFQQIPFQASVHIQDKPGGRVRHLEFLGDPKSDPRLEMAKFLTGAIGAQGTVVAYNAGFEGTRLAELAAAFPRFKSRVLSIKKRLWDIANPFRKGMYVHPDFCGSWSIKVVLPTLVPDTTYDGMAIANGGDASLAYLKLMKGEISGKEAATVEKALKEYCGQDTLAMVKLLDVLQAAAIQGSPVL